MSTSYLNLERCLCTASIVGSVPESPSGANVYEKRNLRIQGRMQIFRKKTPEAFKSSGNKLERRVSYNSKIFLRCLGRRVMVILLQEIHFGPNVIYYVCRRQDIVV